MRNVLIIMKKELKRFFTDKRMLISLLLPGILIFVIYSLMGNVITSLVKPGEDVEYKIYQIHEPESKKELDSTEYYHITIVEETEYSTLEEAKLDLKNKKIDLIISYEENFDQKVSNNEAPKIEIYYNSISSKSSEIYSYYYTNLYTLGSEVTFHYTINSDMGTLYDVATKEDTSIEFITMMMPFLLIIFLMTGCMAISTEAIAGEKERGTISTILVTPIKRSELALGKAFSLSIVGLVSASSSFLGTLLSLPRMMEGMDVNLSMYHIDTYLELFLIIIVTVLLLTTILSIISSLAKSVKEASSYSTPVMIVVMLIGVYSMVGSGMGNQWIGYCIPIYSNILILSNVFGLTVQPLNFVLAIVSNIVYISLGIYILTRMFNSEKVMFQK